MRDSLADQVLGGYKTLHQFVCHNLFRRLCLNLMVLHVNMRITSQLAADVAAWVSTITSTVFLIFINKLLMSNSGCGFHYGNTKAFLILSFSIFCGSADQGAPRSNNAQRMSLRRVRFKCRCFFATFRRQGLELAVDWCVQTPVRIIDLLQPSEYMIADYTACNADLALYVVTADISIISCNLSLMLNPVNVYQA